MHEREGPVTTDRMAVFSDAVVAVIMTVMVLELKAPEEAAFSSLVPLWHTVLSYARAARRRSLAVLGIFAAATLTAYLAPRVAFALICMGVLLHVRPQAIALGGRPAR